MCVTWKHHIIFWLPRNTLCDNHVAVLLLFVVLFCSLSVHPIMPYYMGLVVAEHF